MCAFEQIFVQNHPRIVQKFILCTEKFLKSIRTFEDFFVQKHLDLLKVQRFVKKC